jgi:branched-chain amino acid transport system substrate-binding protein
MRSRIVFLVGALLASPASAASNGMDVVRDDVVRDLAGRVGPIVGAALSCRDIACSRLHRVVDKFQTVIRDASDQETDRADLAAAFDRRITDGTNAQTAGKTNCATAGKQFAEFERTLSEPGFASLASAIGPSFAAATAAAAAIAMSMAPSHKNSRTALDDSGIYRPIELE